MTKLAITKQENGDEWAIMDGVNVADWSPDAVMQRVEAGMGWLLGQPAPHQVVLDDPSGIAVVLITAWLMTNTYACEVMFVTPDDVAVAQVGIWPNRHAFVSAMSPGRIRAIQTLDPLAPSRNAPASR